MRSWFYGNVHELVHWANAKRNRLQVTSVFLVFDLNVSQVTIAFLVLYGLIVAQVASAIFFLWCDCCASHKRVLGFMV